MTDKERIILNAADEELTPENLPKALQRLAQLKEEIQQSVKKIEELNRLKNIFENKLTHDFATAGEVLGKRNAKIFDDKIIPYLESENIKIFDIGADVIFIATAFVYLGLDFGGDEEMKKILPTITAAVKEFYIPVKESTRAAKLKKLNKLISETVQFTFISPNKNKAEDVEEMPMLKNDPLKYITASNSKAMNTLGGFINNMKEEESSCKYGIKPMNDNNILTCISVSIPPADKNVQGLNNINFTEFDRQIYDAVCSVYVYGNDDKIFTPKMIARILLQKKSSDPVPPEFLKKVTESISKMKKIKIKIDATDELQHRFNDDKKRIYGDVMLNTVTMEVKLSNGETETEAHKLVTKPILYLYSETINQILTFDRDLYKIKKPLNKINQSSKRNVLEEYHRMTAERRMLIGYLLRRIQVFKNTKSSSYQKGKMSNIILYESIFNDIEIPTKHSERYKSFIVDCFAYWKDCKYIKSYKERKSKTNKGTDAIIFYT